MTKTWIMINEGHTLLPEQQEILEERYGSWETILIPEKGWSIEEMRSIINDSRFESTLQDEVIKTVVFVSPIAYMIGEMKLNKGFDEGIMESNSWEDIYKISPVVKVFFNAHREAKELPGGKIIHTIAKTGWQLV